MSVACDDLVAFADGELDPVKADEFRVHLRECGTCPDELTTAMQMNAQLSRLEATVDHCQVNMVFRRCGRPATLLLHVSLITRNASIETMLHPVCEECYQAALGDASSRVFWDMVPASIAPRVKFWTLREYQESWPDPDVEGTDL